MTKERRLAILMWQEIKDNLVVDSSFRVVLFKITFCETHSLHWRCSCWLCQYIRRCEKCPLNDCDALDSTYMQVGNVHLPVEVRVEACDKIINALKGELKDGVV